MMLKVAIYQSYFGIIFRARFISLLLCLLLSVSSETWAEQDDSSEILRNSILKFENQKITGNLNVSNRQLAGLDAWIEDSKVNWSNSDLGDFDSQKLSFEVKLKNHAQISAEQNILNMGQLKVDLKLARLLENQLKTTYLSLIDYIAMRNRKLLLKHQKNITNSELNNWKLKVNSDDFRADKLQQAGLTLDSIWADELGVNTALSRYENNKKIRADKTKPFYLKRHNSNRVSLNQVIDITNDIINNRKYEQYNSLIQKAEYEVALINRKRQRYNAQEKLSLNAIKLEYDHKDNDLGFSIGIKMPVTKNNYDSLLQEQEQRYANIDVKNLANDILDQLNEKQFRLVQTKDKWVSNKKLLQRIDQRIIRLSKTNNIELLLELKQERLQRQIQREELHTRALKEYIGFLNTAGMLSAKPYRNWIKLGTPRIL